jgi:REP element-mobilizing transposase RayT
MPAHARCRIVDEATVGIYHCVNRCVRRAFLCGFDAFSGRNFDHRKLWIRQRLESLAGLFAIDVLGFAVMANHLHLIVRNRPDVADQWSDEEVARRWCGLFPRSVDPSLGGRSSGSRSPGSPPTAAWPSPAGLRERMLLADPSQLVECRRRLSSVSWLMRCLCEPIARAANHEDEVSGRFWEGRFKCQALLDEAAVLACSMYVDLNPIRAGEAETPEASQFTSAHERIADRQSAASDSSEPAAGWLAPVAEKVDGGVPAEPPRRRASNRGFLPFSLDDYLRLLDWTGRILRSGCHSIPAGLAPLFERLGLNAATWADCIDQFGRQFRRAVGRAVSLARFAERSGQHWLHGVSWSRRAFG